MHKGTNVISRKVPGNRDMHQELQSSQYDALRWGKDSSLPEG